jgi:hypothetical protein
MSNADKPQVITTDSSRAELDKLVYEAGLPKREVAEYSPGPDDPPLPAPVPDTAHISEKVFYFPDSYNALRKELFENWPNLWELVGWPMAFDGAMFVELMDDALDTKTTFDTHKVDSLCKKYMDLLYIKRGLTPLHATANWDHGPKVWLPGEK